MTDKVDKWEYKWLTLKAIASTDDQLEASEKKSVYSLDKFNILGSEGWETINVDDTDLKSGYYRVLLKRKKIITDPKSLIKWEYLWTAVQANAETDAEIEERERSQVCSLIGLNLLGEEGWEVIHSYTKYLRRGCYHVLVKRSIIENDLPHQLNKSDQDQIPTQRDPYATTELKKE